MSLYRNVAFPPRVVDLDSGRVLAPGEAGEAETSDRHDSMVAARLLAVEPVEPAPVEPAPVEPAPVVTISPWET